MTVSSTSAAGSRLAEAMESAATTKAEAAKGDAQAIRKLANQQSANTTQSTPRPAADPDHDGDAGKLDVKA